MQNNTSNHPNHMQVLYSPQTNFEGHQMHALFPCVYFIGSLQSAGFFAPWVDE
jgi:hypothetical protein